MLKRMISLLMCLVMLVSMLPVQAFAMETEAELAALVLGTESAEKQTEPVVEETEAAEEVTEPAEEVTEPAEEVTEPAEEVTELTEEETEPAAEETEPIDVTESEIIAMEELMTSPMFMADEVSEQASCGENLTWALDEEGTLTISGTGGTDICVDRRQGICCYPERRDQLCGSA